MGGILDKIVIRPCAAMRYYIVLDGYVPGDTTPCSICGLIVMAMPLYGCVFTTALVSLNIPEGVLFTDSVKRLKNDRCFHE